MSYQHLTLQKRYCPAEFWEKGLSIRAIARILKRSPSTISRECGLAMFSRVEASKARAASNRTVCSPRHFSD